MKTILGEKVTAVRFYKNSYNGTIGGSIRTAGDFTIILMGGKFFLQHKDARAHGVISKKTLAGRKIKRAIAIWFRTFRKNNPAFNEDNSYMRSRCIDGLHNVNIFKNMNIPFAENKSKFLQKAW